MSIVSRFPKYVILTYLKLHANHKIDLERKLVISSLFIHDDFNCESLSEFI